MPTAAEVAGAEAYRHQGNRQTPQRAAGGKIRVQIRYNADYHATPFWGHAGKHSGLGVDGLWFP